MIRWRRFPAEFVRQARKEFMSPANCSRRHQRCHRRLSRREKNLFRCKKDAQSSQPLWGNTSVIVRPEQPTRGTVSEKAASADESKTPRKLVQPTVLITDKSASASTPRVAASPSTSNASFGYKVGAGDIL